MSWRDINWSNRFSRPEERILNKKFLTILVGALILSFSLTVNAAGSTAKVDPLLSRLFTGRLPGAKVPVVITYSRMPASAEFAQLQSAGILKGFAMKVLPMVICDMTAAQLSAVRNQPNVVSVWANRVMKPFTNASRPFIGVPQLMADREITARNANNPGFPISGKGIGIGYIDTGIDATHQDLDFGAGKKVVQNVVQPLSQGVVSDGGLVVGVGISVSDLIAGTGFVPPVYLENQPVSDLESGHGTHGAGVAAGLGTASGGFYGGVAQGAHLIGLNTGNDLGLPLVAIINAYDYLLVNQWRYNIRVINNSWGSSFDPSEIDPDNPVNRATRTAHDRNLVVVFAAGNAGDDENAINPYSTMPWTISVAAGEKQGLGTPAGFSSRGKDNGTGTDIAGMPADPLAQPNLRPDITGSGVDIKSTRSKGPGLTNTAGTVPVFVGSNDLSTIPPAFLPFYTTSQGTSFACPQVSGVIALMLEANPQLTPDDVVTLLRQTATPMPYEERVVGAGYVDAHNAVRAAIGLGSVAHPANLFPTADPNAPQITDTQNDQLGTTAQDIRTGRFSYDPATRQIIYTLSLTDLSVKTPNMRWTMTSTFGATDVFVNASVNELETTYEYGKITLLATGTKNQETIGAADSGEIRGNELIIRLSIDKVNEAVGANVLGTTTTNTLAQAQILIGTSATGGLLLSSDTATGSGFKVGEAIAPSPDPTPTPEPTPVATPNPAPEQSPQAGKFDERYAGAIQVGAMTEVPFIVRRSNLDAKLTYNPGNEQLIFQLVDSNGQVVAAGDKGSGISVSNLNTGSYKFRLSGAANRAVDFTIKSSQGK
jgi:serine protease AprX